MNIPFTISLMYSLLFVYSFHRPDWKYGGYYFLAGQLWFIAFYMEKTWQLTQ